MKLIYLDVEISPKKIIVAIVFKINDNSIYTNKTLTK